MIDQKQVELLIRARLKGQEDIGAITKSIAKLGEVITQQADAAKRGESSYEGLKAAISALEAESKKLESRRSALKYFEGLEDRAKRSQASVDRLTKQYQELDATIKASGTGGTEKQVAQLQALSARISDAREKVSSFRKEQANLGEALRAVGVDADNVAGALSKIDDAILAVGQATGRGNKELADYADNLTRGRDAARRLADEQVKLARLQEGNATDARVGRAQQLEAEARAAKKAEQAEADRLALLQKVGKFEQDARGKAQADSELAALRESDKFVKSINDRQAQNAGLGKIADDATAAARGYSTLARASTDLRPKIVSLRDAVDAINDPAKASRKTLAGVEEQIAAVSRAVTQAKGPLKDASDQLRALQSAQKGLSEQAGLVDAYRRQLDALRAQRAEFAVARAEVAKYAAAVRAGGDAGATFVKPLADAQARLKAASAAMREQVTATVALRENLRAAGINTSNLADAQRRMTASANEGAKAARSLAQAAEQQAVASGKGAKGFSLFRDEGRTTLSLVQRIRGELLAMAAAYIGLQGAIGLAGGALKAFTEAEGLRNTLAFAQGVQADSAQISAEVAYLRQQADRLGVSFETASKGYARFSAAALKSGASVEEARFIFESFSEVARVINLTPPQLEGLFTATGQSFSKGKIQAEELRQQIGERLPGAFAFAQQALKDKFPDLDKALEGGKVGAENFVIIMESIRKAAADQLPRAIQSLDAEQQRFNTSVLFFKKEIADAGFAQAYVGLLKQLTDFLGSTDGKAFAQAVGGAFASIANGITDLIKFAREFSTELKAVGLAAASIFGLFAFQRIVTALIAVRNGLLGVGLAATALQKAFVGFQVAALVLNIAAYLYENEDALKSFATKFVATFKTVFSQVGEDVQVFFKRLPVFAAEAIKGFLDRLPSGSLLRKALDYEDLERKLGSLKFDTQIDVQNIRKDAAAARATIRAEFNKEQGKGPVSFRPSQNYGGAAGETTAFPGARPGKPTVDDAGISKRRTEIESLEKALDALDNKIDRKNKDSLSDQMAVVDREFAAMAKRIAELGGKEAVAFARRLSESDLALRTQTEETYNKRRIDSLQGLLTKTEAAEAAAGRRRKTDLDAQLEAISKAYAEMYRDIEAERNIIQDNRGDTGAIDALRERLRLAEADAKASAQKDALNRQLAEREQQINNIVDARASKLKAIDDQALAGVISRSEADQQQIAVIGQMQPLIDGMALSGQSFANAMQGALDPTKLQEFIDKLNLVTGSGARLNAELDRTGKIINEGIGKGVDTTLAAAYDSLVLVAQGSATWGDAFETAGKAILQTLAQILKEIAATIIKEQILIQIQLIRKALSSSSGNLSEAATGAGGVYHSGGVVGAVPNRMRTVSANWFANAPRYHAGGIAGIQPGEYPAILQKNEEVLSNSDPRNVLNGGLKGGNGAQPQAQRFVLVDDRSRVAEAMAGAEGEEVTMIHLRKNIPTLRTLIKGA